VLIFLALQFIELFKPPRQVFILPFGQTIAIKSRYAHWVAFTITWFFVAFLLIGGQAFGQVPPVASAISLNFTPAGYFFFPTNLKSHHHHPHHKDGSSDKSIENKDPDYRLDAANFVLFTDHPDAQDVHPAFSTSTHLRPPFASTINRLPSIYLLTQRFRL
jgi:hypothetical protein